jgi:hypothetical protein
MNASELTEYVRQSHQALGAFLPPDEYLPWAWVDGQVNELAERLYQEVPHWHHWTGRCIGVVPLEMRVAAMGMFGVLWFYEIMLRKARDRHAPDSWDRVEAWRQHLQDTLDFIRQDIQTSKDEEAEERHRATSRPVSRVRHWWNSLWWGH